MCCSFFNEVEVDYNRRGRWLVQSGKVLTTKPDYLSSIPGTHTWKERTNSRKLYSELSTYCGVQVEKTVASNFLLRLWGLSEGARIHAAFLEFGSWYIFLIYLTYIKGVVQRALGNVKGCIWSLWVMTSMSQMSWMVANMIVSFWDVSQAALELLCSQVWPWADIYVSISLVLGSQVCISTPAGPTVISNLVDLTLLAQTGFLCNIPGHLELKIYLLLPPRTLGLKVSATVPGCRFKSLDFLASPGTSESCIYPSHMSWGPTLLFQYLWPVGTRWFRGPVCQIGTACPLPSKGVPKTHPLGIVTSSLVGDSVT